MSATVEIVDVFRGAVRVPVETVRPGDLVFGTYGQRDRVARVRVHRHSTRVTPASLWPLTLPNGETVTVIRAEVGS